MWRRSISTGEFERVEREATAASNETLPNHRTCKVRGRAGGQRNREPHEKKTLFPVGYLGGYVRILGSGNPCGREKELPTENFMKFRAIYIARKAGRRGAFPIELRIPGSGRIGTRGSNARVRFFGRQQGRDDIRARATPFRGSERSRERQPTSIY